jgi:hypothetical protein
MTISAVLLFGSRARGDHEEGSDLDLLFVTSEPQPRHRAVDHISLSLYPLNTLLDRAAGGDLFVCHLVYEAKPIYDPTGELARLRAAFRFCDSYAREVAHASDLGWMLARFGRSAPNSSLANRRIAWCVRTILIARSAERRHPVFSQRDLAAFAAQESVARLIRQKSSDGPPSQEVLGELRRFLEQWGERDPVPAAAEAFDYEHTFVQSGNDVGRQTLEGVMSDQDYA